MRPLSDDTTLKYHYGMENVPVKYIEAEPDFGAFETELTAFLFDKFPQKMLCIRGISLPEHNLLNESALSVSDLVGIIARDGTDRYNPNVAGDRYGNVENKRIDFFALDFDTCGGENNFWYMFNTIYYYGIQKHGVPRMVDILAVYDTEKLHRVEYMYEGSDEIRSDAFVFPTDPVTALLGIVTIN